MCNGGLGEIGEDEGEESLLRAAPVGRINTVWLLDALRRQARAVSRVFGRRSRHGRHDSMLISRKKDPAVQCQLDALDAAQ